jgi:hypothetical protein
LKEQLHFPFWWCQPNVNDVDFALCSSWNLAYKQPEHIIYMHTIHITSISKHNTTSWNKHNITSNIHNISFSPLTPSKRMCTKENQSEFKIITNQNVCKTQCRRENKIKNITKHHYCHPVLKENLIRGGKITIVEGWEGRMLMVVEFFTFELMPSSRVT